MTANDYDKVFGSKPAARPQFTERVGRANTPDLTAEAHGDAAGGGAYKAYGHLPAGGIGETCDVQRWVDDTEIAEGIEFQYRFLLQIAYVGEEQLRLFLPDSIVVIEGKKLRDLRKKLARRQVTFIQQFNSGVWAAAPPKAEPIIERIEVVRPSE